MKNFYMTLLSNSSMDYHPLNTTGSFTVQLPRYMYMEGPWEAALTEIHYPYTFANVEPGQNGIHLKTTNITPEYIKWHKSGSKNDQKWLVDKESYKITDGFYSDINAIIEALNNEINRATGQKTFFMYNKLAHRVFSANNDVEEGRKWIETCKLSPRLAQQLGYPPDKAIRHKTYADHVVNTALLVPDKMLIYCDILEPQVYGDSWARALRLVNTSPVNKQSYFGQACSLTFNPPQYIPLQQKHFEAVSIDIRDIEGKLMPFQYGTLSVKLHFRKIKDF